MGTVFKVQEAPTVNVTCTGDSFPVHRIYCLSAPCSGSEAIRDFFCTQCDQTEKKQKFQDFMKAVKKQDLYLKTGFDGIWNTLSL